MPAPVLAQTRTAPEATQHALDELANAIAQGKITLTPTPSSTPTVTPLLATETPTPAPLPTDTPAPSPTDPPLPVPDLGQATAGYVRPTTREPSGTWLELALPQGRWAVLYDASLCAAPAPWTNVWLALDEQSDRPITADRQDAAMCAVAAWSWSSDVPCAADDQGTCDVNLDGAYWDALAQTQPTPTDTPAATVVPRVPTARPAAPVAVVQVQRVVQTVVSVQTVIVLVTPEAAATTSTPRPTTTRSPSPTASRTPSPSASPTLLPIARPTSAPPPADTLGRARALVNDSNRLWVFGLLFGTAAVGGAWFWFTRGRRRYVL
jgi:hypothetical protein